MTSKRLLRVDRIADIAFAIVAACMVIVTFTYWVRAPVKGPDMESSQVP
jgi:hypothetical protein